MFDGSERPQPADVLLMVGTRKGAFLLWSNPERRVWRRSHHHGEWSVHAVSYDSRNGSIYAATNHNYLNEIMFRSKLADDAREGGFNDIQPDSRACGR